MLWLNLSLRCIYFNKKYQCTEISGVYNYYNLRLSEASLPIAEQLTNESYTFIGERASNSVRLQQLHML